MKTRQKKMLEFLLEQSGSVSIEFLADRFSVGKRTVSRDLDFVDHWLSLRGALLERRQNHGIQVQLLGKDPGEILARSSSSTEAFDSISPQMRQDVTLLYLIFHNREIKISEIAQAFFLSDTSVWNDLNQIEESLNTGVMSLERRKGVGIHLTGDEETLRLEFLRIFTERFTLQTIIPYLYGEGGAQDDSLEAEQFRMIMQKLRFPGKSRDLMERISDLDDELGYSLSIGAQSLLYFYLQITRHRIKTGAFIDRPPRHRALPRFRKTGLSLLSDLTEKIYSGGELPWEAEFLGLLIQSLEIGDISMTRLKQNQDMVAPEIESLISSLIGKFGEIDNELYYLQEPLFLRLNLSIASLSTRLQNGIPAWHSDYGFLYEEDQNLRKKSEAAGAFFQEILGITISQRDVRNLLVHFQSLILTHFGPHMKRMRCMICCSEGIGAASYLQAALQKEIPQIEIVEATAAYRVEPSYLREKQIDLVLSTFPLGDIGIPVVLLALPCRIEEIKGQVLRSIARINITADPLLETSFPSDSSDEEKLPFDMVWDFISRFQFLTLEGECSAENQIGFIAARLTSSPEEEAILAADLSAREELGSLFFEDAGVRVFHCKTVVFGQAWAGVIDTGEPPADDLRADDLRADDLRADDSEGSARSLFLVAPDPCPVSLRKMLSTITISFLEEPAFRQSVMSGSRDDIKKQLVEIYKDLL